MPRIKVHFYGLIKGDIFSREFDIDTPYTLADLERDIVRAYGDNLGKDYRNGGETLNHRLVRVGDKSGRRLEDPATDISGLKEIWFVVPFAGG